MITCGIYKIINVKNKKFYIGSSINIEKRKYHHINSLRKDKHFNRHLQRAFNKYGEEWFEFSIIEKEVELDKLTEREQYYIDTLKPEYNQRKTAEIRGLVIIPKHLRIKRSKECHFRKLDHKQIIEIQELRNSGMLLKDIGKIYNIHPSHISRVANKTAWYGGYSSDHNAERKKICNRIDKVKLMELNNSGCSQGKIAKIFGVDPSSISKMLKQITNAKL